MDTKEQIDLYVRIYRISSRIVELQELDAPENVIKNDRDLIERLYKDLEELGSNKERFKKFVENNNLQMELFLCSNKKMENCYKWLKSIQQDVKCDCNFKCLECNCRQATDEESFRYFSGFDIDTGEPIDDIE